MTTATMKDCTFTSGSTAKKKPAVCEVRCDGDNIEIHLSKRASVALTSCRDVLAALAATAPTVSAQANGIRKALDALIDDLACVKSLPVAEDDDLEDTEILERGSV